MRTQKITVGSDRSDDPVEQVAGYPACTQNLAYFFAFAFREGRDMAAFNCLGAVKFFVFRTRS
jgi:hypothetical protein